MVCARQDGSRTRWRWPKDLSSSPRIHEPAGRGKSSARACGRTRQASRAPLGPFDLEIRLREWPGHVVPARTALGWRNLCAVAALSSTVRLTPSTCHIAPNRRTASHSRPSSRGAPRRLAVLTGGPRDACVSLTEAPQTTRRAGARVIRARGDHARADAPSATRARAIGGSRIASPSRRRRAPRRRKRLPACASSLADDGRGVARRAGRRRSGTIVDVVATSGRVVPAPRGRADPPRAPRDLSAEKRRLHLDGSRTSRRLRAPRLKSRAVGTPRQRRGDERVLRGLPGGAGVGALAGEELESIRAREGPAARLPRRGRRALDAPAQVAELALGASDGLARRLVERRKRAAPACTARRSARSYRRLREVRRDRADRLRGLLSLIVADFCQWARRNGSARPRAGSAASSLAVYARVTDVDPERWGPCSSAS